MPSALIEVCVDPRLNHEIIRLQVRQRLERNRLRADRIWVLNDLGGDLGTGFRRTVQLLIRFGDPVVLCAALHHDDCLAAQAGERADLAVTTREMTAELKRRGISCPILTGQIRTATNQLIWSDEPESRYYPFSFGPG